MLLPGSLRDLCGVEAQRRCQVQSLDVGLGELRCGRLGGAGADDVDLDVIDEAFAQGLGLLELGLEGLLLHLLLLKLALQGLDLALRSLAPQLAELR
eukprot:14352178-Alexandrium_andersonii.AAC.1